MAARLLACPGFRSESDAQSVRAPLALPTPIADATSVAPNRTHTKSWSLQRCFPPYSMSTAGGPHGRRVPLSPAASPAPDCSILDPAEPAVTALADHGGTFRTSTEFRRFSNPPGPRREWRKTENRLALSAIASRCPPSVKIFCFLHASAS